MSRDARRRPARGPAAASLALAAAVVAALVAAQGPAPLADDLAAPASPAAPGSSASGLDVVDPGPAGADLPAGGPAAQPSSPDSAGGTVPGTTTVTASSTTGSTTDAPGTTSAAPDGATASSTPVPATDPAPAAPGAPAVPAAQAAPVAQPGPRPAATATQPAPGPAAAAPGVVTGTLTRVWADTTEVEAAGSDEHASHEEHADDEGLNAYLESAEATYPLAAADVGAVEDGSTVTVELGAPRPTGTHPARVLQVREPVAAAGEVLYGEGSQDVFGVAAAGVVHEVTVVLAVPRGATADGTTAAAVASAVDGGVNTFWSQQTRGQRGFRVVAAHGWQNLSTTCSDAFGLWEEAASRVGFTAGPRKHLLVSVPGSAGCGAGLGTVGSPDSGGRSYVSGANPSVIAHELGHNMGLGHSNGLLCGSAQDGGYASGAWQGGCTVHDYRDYYDVMGISWSHLGSLAAPQADALGVLRSTEKLAVSAPARVRLVPATSEGLRALRVDDPAGTYYVEYRIPSAWDGWLANNYRGLDAGVLVHRTSPVRAREVLLLDGSVTGGARTDDWRAALPAGGSFTSASGTTRVVVESADEAGATLVVYRDGAGPAPVSPPSGGAQVDVRSPGTGVRAGSVAFSGVATAPEGTLLWEVTQNGAQKASGYAQTGANGTFDSFTVPVSLPAGTFTFRAWVPDDSSGEGRGGSLFTDSLTVTVS